MFIAFFREFSQIPAVEQRCDYQKCGLPSWVRAPHSTHRHPNGCLFFEQNKGAAN